MFVRTQYIDCHCNTICFYIKIKFIPIDEADDVCLNARTVGDSLVGNMSEYSLPLEWMRCQSARTALSNPTKAHMAKTYMRSDMESWRRWSVAGLGVLVGGLSLAHLSTDTDSSVVFFQELLPPIMVSFVLVLLGIRLGRSTLDEKYFTRILVWAVGGLVIFGLIGLWMFAHHVLAEGTALDEGLHEITTNLATGALAGTIVGAYDVRQRERRAELQRAETVIESTMDGIAVLDEDDRYVAVNQSYTTVYGYDTPEQLVGEQWRCLLADENRDRFEEEIRPRLAETGNWRGEATGRRSDESTFPEELSMSEIDSAGRVCVTRDITARKERERVLQRQNERLEEFANVVSHDLRNPLRVAAGYLDLLSEEIDEHRDTRLYRGASRQSRTGETNGYFETIQNAHERMNRIIKDVLKLARQGSTVGETNPVSLADVAEAAWNHVETHDARLVLEDGLGTAEADRGRLEALFENLFRNAVEHGREDVTCRVGPLADGFFVEDDGPGIPAEQRDRVFESGHTTTDSGTGFGLSIVKSIAEAHGWEITLAETDTGGARFETQYRRSLAIHPA